MSMLMTAMTIMHEQVHERTSEKNQVGEQAKKVRGVLSDQEEAGNEQKSDQDERPAPAYLMGFSAWPRAQ